jgi:S1-C subfamily serine protease
MLLAAAVLGSSATTGVLAASGALGTGSSGTTTAVVPSGVTMASTTGSANNLDAAALYANASPGVVDITAKGVSTAGAAAAGPFGAPQPTATATGTGFVVDGSGHIVTAAHVVNGASSVTVRFQDGTTRPATLLGQDDATDVAVLKVDASGLTLHPLALGSSSSVGVGGAVAAVGDPFGYQRSLSTGIVSGVDRTVQSPNGFTVAHAIQTDAALNPGNSGGPLLNASGQVVGIVDQIATNGSADQSSGVGFAVPIDVVKSELGALEAGKSVSHAYLGVASADATSTANGATLGSVAPGGPAASAGLQAGDVVTRIGTAAIHGANDLVAAIAGHAPGDKVPLTVQRGSRTLSVTVTLGTQPAQSAPAG